MQLFSHFGALADVRVMGSQCYGFVTFQRPEAAQEVLQRFSQKPIVASGHELRINIAYGELPEWKVSFHSLTAKCQSWDVHVSRSRCLCCHLGDMEIPLRKLAKGIWSCAWHVKGILL